MLLLEERISDAQPDDTLELDRELAPRLAIAHFLSKMCEEVIFTAGSVET